MVDKVGGVEFDVTIDSTGAVTAGSKIIQNNEKIEDSFQDVDLAAKKSSDTIVKGSKKAGKAIGGMGRNVGMAGVQIGQFAGQIQGGQSALLAFSQQGADIGMLFGPAGMIAGGIVAVGAALAGTLMPGLMDSTDATKNLADKLRELQKENKLTEAQTKFLADQEVIANKIKEDRIKEIKEEIKETETLIKRINSQADSLGRMGKAAQIRIDSGEIEVAESRVTELNAEMDELQGKTGGDTDAVALAARRAKESAESRINILKKSLESEEDLLSTNAQNRKNIENGIISAAEAAAIEGDIAKRSRMDMSHDALMQSLNREKQAILDSETIKAEEKAALIQGYNDLEDQARQNHLDKIKKQGKDHADAMIKIKEMEEASKMQAVSLAFSNMSQLMNTESRKMFEIGKVAAIAGAVVNTIAGANRALKDFPAPFSYAVAASTAAAGFAQVRAIQSTSFGSSGSGQSIQGGQVSNNVNGGGVGPQQNNQDISISVTGGDDAGRSILNLVNMTIANGGKIGGG